MGERDARYAEPQRSAGPPSDAIQGANHARLLFIAGVFAVASPLSALAQGSAERTRKYGTPEPCSGCTTVQCGPCLNDLCEAPLSSIQCFYFSTKVPGTAYREFTFV